MICSFFSGEIHSWGLHREEIECWNRCKCVSVYIWRVGRHRQTSPDWFIHQHQQVRKRTGEEHGKPPQSICSEFMNSLACLFIQVLFLSLNLFPDNIFLQYSYCKIFVFFFSVWCVWNWGCDLGEDKKDRDRSWWQRDRSGVVSRKSCY